MSDLTSSDSMQGKPTDIVPFTSRSNAELRESAPTSAVGALNPGRFSLTARLGQASELADATSTSAASTRGFPVAKWESFMGDGSPHPHAPQPPCAHPDFDSGIVSVGAGKSVPQSPVEGAVLAESPGLSGAEVLGWLGSGMDKACFGPRELNGRRYVWLETSPEVTARETSAVEAMLEAGVAPEFILECHLPTEGAQWSPPQSMTGEFGDPVVAVCGYWAEAVNIRFGTKPKGFAGFGAVPPFGKRGQPYRKTKNDPESASRVVEQLRGMKTQMEIVCSHVGEVSILVDEEGTCKFSDYSPDENGCTASQADDQVVRLNNEGLDKLIAYFSQGS